VSPDVQFRGATHLYQQNAYVHVTGNMEEAKTAKEEVVRNDNEIEVESI